MHKFTCPECNSEEVRRDAFAEWDIPKQDWVLHDVYNDYCCDTCGFSFTEPNEVEIHDDESSTQAPKGT